jgi:hypothetical protein
MRKLIALAVVFISIALASPGAAQQDAEVLRRELEQMRKNFETMQQDYKKSMDAMAERLRRLEAQPAVVAAPPARTETPERAVAERAGEARGPASPIVPASPIDLLRPRQPFSLYGQRGSGQILFDFGVAGDFVGNLVQRNVDKAGAGTFRGRENRFFPREVELNLWGQIDPFARAEVRIEMAEERRGQETAVSLAEANLTLMTLPFNTQLKMGQMRSRYGWSNQLHEEALPWTDRPGVFRTYFGEEGLTEKGAELTWVPDLPFYLEALVGAFNGDNETAFGRGRISEPLLTGRLRTFFELGDEHAIQLGASFAHGRTAERQTSTLPGFDVRYKYRPEGWLHPLVTAGGEGIWSIRRAEVTRDLTIDTDADGIPDTTVTLGNHRTNTRFGYYLFGELQPFRRWAFGARYDYTEQLLRGREKAIEPYVSFRPSEFLRFRLGYKLTERSSDVGNSANDAMARHLDEFFFQATFILGAHPAHPF